MYEYRRKISREEAEQGYILIENKKETPAKVKAVSCICQGPEEPHQHYQLSYSPLTKGEIIVIRPGEKSMYTLKREKTTSAL